MYIKGLWFGFSIACVILDLGFCVIICLPNWHKIALKFRDMNTTTSSDKPTKIDRTHEQTQIKKVIDEHNKSVSRDISQD